MPPTAATRSLPVVLSGPPRERGRAHGEAFRPLIRQLLEAWDEDVGNEVGMTLPAYLDIFEADTDFLPAIRQWTPHLIDEVEGIAEGANIPLRVCRCLQCMDEHWTHLDTLQASRPDKCSTLGAAPSDTAPTLLGQNMDLPKFLDGFQTLLKIEYENGLQVLVPSYAGFLGLFGVNSLGLGLCVNAISQLKQASQGLPVAFVVRGLLERQDCARAADWLHRLPHASGQNYLLGDPAGLVDLECCTAGVVRHEPKAKATLCHTNHPLASEELGDDYLGWDEDRSRANEAHALTFERLETLDRELRRGPHDAVSLRPMLAAVAHRIDCPYPTFTFCSAVLELQDEPCMHIALGRPDVTPYRTHRLA